jgi:glycosyltransferase involved in cell wall biosynthesis
MPTTPPRILLVTHYYADHHGGVEIVAGELAARLAGHGCRVTWAASGPAPALAEGVVPLPMAACHFAERRCGFPYPLWGPRGLARLWRAVEEADIVHLHDSLYFGNVAAYGMAKWSRKPVIVTQHVGAIPYRSRLLRLLLTAANQTLGRAVLGGSEQTVFIAEQVRRHFEGFVRFRRPPLLWPNGIDHSRFRPVSGDERRRLRGALGLGERPALLFVGRFVEKKGLDLLRPMVARHADCDWLFAGWGRLDPAKWGLANARVVGRVEHERLAQYYQAADLLVLPSLGEGFPLVVQEAMACGTPALITRETATGCPGIENVALVCEPRSDDVGRVLAEALASPHALRGRRERVAAFTAERWNWDDCAARYLALVRELTGMSDHDDQSREFTGEALGDRSERPVAEAVSC